MNSEILIVGTIIAFLGIVYAVSKGRAKKSGPKPSTSEENNQVK